MILSRSLLIFGPQVLALAEQQAERERQEREKEQRLEEERERRAAIAAIKCVIYMRVIDRYLAGALMGALMGREEAASGVSVLLA